MGGGVAGPGLCRSLDRRRLVCPLPGSTIQEGRSMTMTIAISACLSAFGLGYAAGSWIRLTRKAIESLD